ncbi:putative transglutaminase elicitor [Plasmopara halstedii]
MRTSSLISTTFALTTIQVRGSPSTAIRRLGAIPQHEESVLIEMEQHFGQKLERKLTRLPTWGASDIKPWYGQTWETWTDSINYAMRDDDLAPSAKYAIAVGLNVEEFMDKVSAKFGIDSVKNSTSTTRCPVTFNNVTFNPDDIKALISVVYTEAQVPTIYGGKYFPGQNGTLDGSIPSAPPQYRNLNQSFIFDTYSDERVFNLAAYAFEVDRQQPMTLQEAARVFFNSTSYTFNEKATEVVYVSSTLYFVDSKMNDYPRDTYTYILELDATGDCIGVNGWTADLITGISISYANVLMLIDKSAACSN